MATDSFENDGNPFGNLIRTAVGLTPLAGAGYVAFNKIRGNTALNPAIPFGVGTGNLTGVASELGKELKTSTGKSRAADLAKIDKVTKELMKADTVQKMFSSVEEQRVLIQSLLDTMSDPTSGLGQDVLLSYREKLLNLATNAPTSDELKDTVKAVMNAVNTQGTDNARVRLAKNLREYRKLGPNLVPPSQTLTAGKSYIDLSFAGMKGQMDPSAYKAVRSRYKTLTNALGQGGASRVQLVGKNFDGAFQVYARVSSGNRFIANVPLHLGGGTNSGLRAAFLNEGMTTGYAVPAKFLSGQKLAAGLGGDFNKAIGEAGVNVEDFFLNRFTSSLKDMGGRIQLEDPSGYRAWQRQFFEVLPREAYSFNSSGHTNHLLRTMAQSQNFATVVGWEGIDKDTQKAVMTTLGASSGFDANAPGYQMLIRGLNNETIGRMGLGADSAISNINSVFGNNRLNLPVESRIEQVLGRQGQFVASNHMRMGKGNVFTAGAVSVGDLSASRMVGQNIEWANNLTGATNKAVVMVFDDKNPIYKTMEGSGAALYAGRDSVISYSQKPILDPKSSGQMSSKLLEHITGNYQPGQPFKVTQDMLKQHGNFLGFSGNGPQHLRIDPRATGMEAVYDVTSAGGKTNINLMLRTQRDMESWKSFSLSFKGMLQNVGGRKMIRTLNDLGLNKATRRRLNMPLRHTVVATPDMLKKGSGILEQQMAGAYAMVTGDSDYLNTIRKAGLNHGQGLADPRLARTYGGVVDSLAAQLNKGAITAEDVGLVLSGAWHMGPKHEKFGLTEDLQKSVLGKAFGKEYDNVLASIKKGVGLFPSTMTQGSGPGDYGLGRGSIEPRFLQMFQHRLKMMGFSSVDSAKIMADIYSRKMGGANSLKAASGMMKFLESVGGAQGLATGIDQLIGGVPEYGLGDLGKIASQDFADFLAKHPKGFTLNLTSGADSVAKSAIAAGATDILKQGNIYFPGMEMTEAMRDTFIKNANGPDTVVHGEWMRNAENFIKNIHGVSTQTIGADKAARSAIEGFVERGRRMAAGTIHDIHKGKIKGMQSMVVLPLALDSNVAFDNPAHHRYARNIMKRTRGQATFFDSTAFLSQLSDYMGSKGANANSAARQAEMFFLSPEEAFAAKRAGKAKGLVQVGQRHPTGSMGNIFVSQVFMDPREVGQKNRYLDKFLETDSGKGWAAKGIRRFKDVQGLSKGQRRAFFTQFVGALEGFAPEGGGLAYMPKGNAKVHLTGANKPFINVDIGFTSAAIGDYDGDTFMFTPVNTETGKKLLGRMGAKEMAEWQSANAMYKVKTELFTEEAKAGLTRMAEEMKKYGDKGLNVEDAIRQGLLKEQAAKEAVGSLDTRLTKLRLALVDMHVAKGSTEVTDALNLLKVVQEHTTIKGKKLPLYMPFAENLTHAVDRIFESGDWGSFERVLKEDVFRGSQLVSGGISIDRSESGFGFFNRAVQQEQVSLDSMIGTMKQAVSRSEVSGVSDAATSNWIVKGLASENPVEAERMMTLMISGKLQSTATLLSATEGAGATTKQALAKGQGVLQNIGNYVSGLDRKTTGIVMGGMVLAAATMSMLGSKGYGSSPLLMPGEIAGNDIDKQISSGNLLGTPGRNYPTATPQMNGTMYMQGRSNYSVRGNLRNGGDIGNAVNYINGISGGNARGSVSIHDNRRPLTANYLDRLMGEY